MPHGIVEDVLIQVDKFYFPIDFIVIDTKLVQDSKKHIPIILDRPFLATADVHIQCRTENIQLSFGSMTMELNIFNISKQPHNVDYGIVDVDLIEELVDNTFFSNFSNDPLQTCLAHFGLNFDIDRSVDEVNALLYSAPSMDTNKWKSRVEQLTPSEKKLSPSSESPLKLEIKPLPNTSFTDIVNTPGALEKTFSNSEKVKKIIRSLPKEWRPKRTAIEEAKDLNILPIDDLIGLLISYEEDLAAERGNEEKKKSIALKATKYESDRESESDDEELAMLARRFRKFFKKIGDRRKFRNLKNQKEKKEVIICYECKKPGHIRSECPLLNKLKKKATVTTWDDNGEDSSDEEESQEVSNLALMAIGDDDDLNEISDPTYDELYDAFKEMHDELMTIGKKNECLKKKLLELTNEKDAMQKCNDSLNEKIKGLELENKTLHNRVGLPNKKPSTSHEHLELHVDDLKKENEMLKKKNIELSDVMLKFKNGQKMLGNMLNSKKYVFDKGGLGYKPNLKQKYYKNLLKLPPQVIIKLFVIIVIKMVT
ncbi:hypothetical protein KPL70_003526 [Citrus sinensis]|nr:hypothetical protein KPL70_003526 [Citrus sinensis]